MSAKYPPISHTVIIGTIDTTVPLMPLVTQIYREGGLGTLGMNASPGMPEIPAADFLVLASSMLALSSKTRWTSYPVILSGKTPSKAATFRLFFRVSPSNKRGQIASGRTKQ